MKRYKGKNQLLFLYLGVGFLIGILYQNIVATRSVVINEMFLKSNLQRLLQTEVKLHSYLTYVLKERILLFVIVCLAGSIRWKKVVVAVFLLLVGIAFGIVSASAVLQLGLSGIVLCIVGIFPQCLFYIVQYALVGTYWYHFPNRQWNTFKSVFVAVMCLAGGVVETYVNPVLVRWVVQWICK